MLDNSPPVSLLGLGQVIGVSPHNVRMASEREVMEAGFEIGGVAAFGAPKCEQLIIDKCIIEEEGIKEYFCCRMVL